MGQTIVTLTMHGPLGSTEVEALADTGSTFTMVPRSALDKIGVEASYESAVVLGDGRTVTRALALAEIEIERVRRPVLVSIAGEEAQPLAGYTTMETLGFKVNPVTHSLEPAPPIEY